MKAKKKTNRISNLFSMIVLVVVVYFAYEYYQTNNFKDIVRSETNLYTSHFTRDKEVKYDKERSYKIESPTYNDAMFYKTIPVEKNQPYKVTCMVKTNQVQSKEEQSGVGAQLSIEGTTERSVAIAGTQDWQKIELIFNAKNREEVNIGCRLGGYLGEAQGEAWFTDLKVEKGTVQTNNEWKFACFIFQTTDVTIDGKQIQLAVTQNDIRDIKNTLNSFESSCYNLSNGKMVADCDIYQIDTPLSKLSYDKEFGYYVSAEDIEDQIKDMIEANDYDHIFAIVRLRR